MQVRPSSSIYGTGMPCEKVCCIMFASALDFVNMQQVDPDFALRSMCHLGWPASRHHCSGLEGCIVARRALFAISRAAQIVSSEAAHIAGLLKFVRDIAQVLVDS